MRQWNGSSLVQIVVYYLLSAKPLSELMLIDHKMHLTKELKWNWIKTTITLIHEKAFELHNICKCQWPYSGLKMLSNMTEKGNTVKS